MRPAFLTAAWRKLVMANYRVDPVVLRPYLPACTVPDDFEGRYYVSLVGFLFDNVRLRGWRIPYHTRFPEVNLRFYVKRDIPDNPGSIQRGVVFIKEIVPLPSIAWVANSLYKENYIATPMRYEWLNKGETWKILYEWGSRGGWSRIQAEADNRLLPMPAGSEEAFIFEHYYGYARRSATVTHEYEVAHPSWQHYRVKDFDIVCDFEKVYGRHFAFLNLQQPASVFLAEGSDVAVYPKQVLHSA